MELQLGAPAQLTRLEMTEITDIVCFIWFTLLEVFPKPVDATSAKAALDNNWFCTVTDFEREEFEFNESNTDSKVATRKPLEVGPAGKVVDPKADSDLVWNTKTLKSWDKKPNW
jgi:hypothetical protein